MAEFPASLLDSTEQPGIRNVALALLTDARSERDRLATAPADGDALHDFRVAVRRLRSWMRAHREALGAGSLRAADRALRRVAQATNGSRDAEVFVAWLEEARTALPARQQVGVAWLLREVAADRPSGPDLVLGGVAAHFARADELLSERLPLYRVVHHVSEGTHEPAFAAAMALCVRRHAAALRRRLHRAQGGLDDAAVHRARIAGKRLRYLLEPVAPHLTEGSAVIDQLKALQDALGDIHDSHVWFEGLRRRFERLAADEARRLADASESPEPAANWPDVRPGLLAVTGSLRDRTRERQGAVALAWDKRACDNLLAAVERLAAAIDHHGVGLQEIERKFLLYALPEHWPEGEVLFIDQGYLPGARLIERLRRVRTRDRERYYRTVKSGTGLARMELEEETTREVFDAMWPLTVGRRVSKRRHRIPDGEVVWEVDEFTDRSLVLAEVELRRVDQDVVLPDWLAPTVARDVTGEPEYVNANLAR